MAKRTSTTPILIAGATASGKSALALTLAERFGGVVINADSMQVYDGLPIITAQPSPDEKSRAPHRLYGHVSPSDAYSVARYIADAAREIATATAAGQRSIIVGGTGLYFKALLEGLSPVPEIPAEIREHWRANASSWPIDRLHAELAARDPVMADRLAPTDRQRITRALEVIDATGRSLGEWQKIPGTPLLDEAGTIRLVVNRPRDEIIARCDARFDQMIGAGALDEVGHLLALDLPRDLPVFGALGVRPLADFLEGRTSLPEAIAAGKLQTRQYVKRQETWLKRHMMSWREIFTQEMERNSREILSDIDFDR